MSARLRATPWFRTEVEEWRARRLRHHRVMYAFPALPLDWVRIDQTIFFLTREQLAEYVWVEGRLVRVRAVW